MGGRQVNKKQALGNNPPLPRPPGIRTEKTENPLAKIFQQKEKPYVPVTQSLEEADIESIIMDMNIDDKIVECLVIPLQELIYKEWRHMTKSELVTKSQNEEQINVTGPIGLEPTEIYSSPEVGGPGDVQSGADQPGDGSDSPTPELQ